MCLVYITSSHYHPYLNNIETFTSYGSSLYLVSVLIFIISTMWLSAIYVLRGIFKERHKGRFLRLDSSTRLASGEEKATLLFYKESRKQLALIVQVAQ